MKEKRNGKGFPLFAAGITAVVLAVSFSACRAVDGSGAGHSESAESVSESASVSSSPSEMSSSEPSPSSSELSQPFSEEPSSAVSNPSPAPAEPVQQNSPSAAIPPSAGVDDSYFSDALFIGDSLTQGLSLYGNIKTADYCCETSATTGGVTGVTPLLSMLSSKSYGKIYIMLGINEVSGSTERYLSNYANLLQTIRSYQPNAALCIQTILPTNPSMTWSSSAFSVQNVTEKNRGLEQLAAQQGAHLIDVYSAYADERGEMPAGYCRDGVHPHAEAYQYWCDYLRTHTV